MVGSDDFLEPWILVVVAEQRTQKVIPDKHCSHNLACTLADSLNEGADDASVSPVQPAGEAGGCGDSLDQLMRPPLILFIIVSHINYL